MKLSSVFFRYIPVAHERSAWLEAIGYLFVGLGIILGLAEYSYSPADYLSQFVVAQRVHNLCGPLGAQVADVILRSFGIIGLLIPGFLCLWGVFIIFGFLGIPTVQRFLGVLISLIALACLAETQMPRFAAVKPIFGYGGLVGQYIGQPLYRSLDYEGSGITIIMTALVLLRLTGNLAISNTALHVRKVLGLGSDGVKRVWKFISFHQPSEAILLKRVMQEVNAMGEEVDDQPVKRAQRHAAHKQKVDIDVVSFDDESEDLEKGGIDGLDTDSPLTDVEPLSFYYEGKAHPKPTAGMFAKSEPAVNKSANFKKMADKLTAQLQMFKVEGKVVNVSEGPVVTTFEFEPAPGTKVSKITALAEDLARLLQAKSLRILAPIPGKKTLGFEVPNEKRRMIGFNEFATSKALRSTDCLLPIALGMDAFGRPVIEDLTKMPHLLVAGSTGSGKSVFMNTLIASLISRHSAKDLRFIMVDPKMVELVTYNDLPHMACPVVTDPTEDVKRILSALVKEMEQRFQKMRIVGARNIQGFNDTIRRKKKSNFSEFEGNWQTMPFIVLIIDELADMIMVLGKDAEIPITRLAQKARAAGIHLVIATQRPSAEVVTGLIKANFPTRVAFRVLSAIDSRTILDTAGAETLLGQGDMLYLNATGLTRMHGAYLSDAEVKRMVRATKS